MKFKKQFFHTYCIVLLLISMFSEINGSLYQISQDNSDDIKPKIIIDSEDKIWCFWLSNRNDSQESYHLYARYLFNEQLSPIIQVTDSVLDADNVFDVDLDNDNQLWVAINRSVNSYYHRQLQLFKKNQINEFEMIANIDRTDNISFNRGFLTLSAINDNNILIDAKCEDYFYGLHYKLFHFNGTEFQLLSWDEQGITEYSLFPVSSFKIDTNAYFWLAGGFSILLGDNGSCGYLFPVSYSDTVCIEEPNEIYFYSNEWAPDTYIRVNNKVFGCDVDGYYYYFEDKDVNVVGDSLYNYKKFEIYNSNNNVLLKQEENINFSPSAVSENNTYLVTAWLSFNHIYLKAFDDTIVYMTSQIPEETLLNDNSRQNISVWADDFPNALLVWEGIIEGQSEIFLIDYTVSDIIDTNLTDICEYKNDFSKNFTLYQNYPNPFNPATIIKYKLSVTAEVNLSVYNIMGQKIKTLIDKKQLPGHYSVKFNGSGLPCGTYFYTIQAGNKYSKTHKMLLIK